MNFYHTYFKKLQKYKIKSISKNQSTSFKKTNFLLLPFSADYFWEIEFPEDRHLIEKESRRKQYYYDYYQTATTYDDARKICQDRGEGWDLAGFQAIPDVDRSASAKNVK